MDTFISFLTVLAWFGFVLGGLSWFYCVYMNHRYRYPKPGTVENLQRLSDELKGINRYWPVGRWLILTLISVAWLIATW